MLQRREYIHSPACVWQPTFIIIGATHCLHILDDILNLEFSLLTLFYELHCQLQTAAISLLLFCVNVVAFSIKPSIITVQWEQDTLFKTSCKELHKKKQKTTRPTNADNRFVIGVDFFFFHLFSILSTPCVSVHHRNHNQGCTSFFLWVTQMSIKRERG